MASPGRPKKICLIRLDKIGDLVCTLPADQIEALRGWDVRWVIALGLGFVAAHASPGRRFLQLNKNRKWESFRALLIWLRIEKFDVAVSFQAPWWASLALWWAGIPVRAGVKSQWHGFLFFNRGLRQKRSLAEKHESEYNVELLAHALKIATPPNAPILKMHAPALPDVQDRIALPAGSFVVVHPGMAGSALNWSQENYVTLIRELSSKRTVAVTGTPADEPWLKDIRAGLEGTPNVRWLVGELTPTELLTILGDARLVIAPSTGVAHLAAALGRAVICFFSPRRVQRSLRWRPRGPAVVTLTPELKPGENSETVGPEIMDRVTVGRALEIAEPWL